MRIILCLGLIMQFGLIYGQNEYKMKPNDNYIEIDFLSSYYEQDGNNAAVTGGIGTEKLTDLANIIVVNIPLDSIRSVSITGGVDIYSSASTDNIDNNRSSASSKDSRTYINVGYSHKYLENGFTLGGRVGFSTEYDYTSVNGGISLTKEYNNGNTEISFSGQAFIDKWKTYFPQELKGKVSVATSSRNSFNGQLTWSQVINKRMQVSLSTEIIYMNGLLSTPFHRVYFADVSTPDIERLPDTRIKIPLAIRWNYKPMDDLTIRTYYRYYTDDFGISAHTASLELPINLSAAWTIAPFFRYHSQTSADYFAPFQEHFSGELYYTSDYDLSELRSTKYGLGISYSPLYGLARLNLPLTKKIFKIHSIAFRVSKYVRDTGLTGYSFALGLGMRI